MAERKYAAADAYGSTEPPAYEWRKPDAGDGGWFSSDHVWHPMLVDSEGRRWAVEPFAPSRTHIVRREIVQRFETHPSTVEYPIPRARPLRRYDDALEPVLCPPVPWGSPTRPSRVSNETSDAIERTEARPPTAEPKFGDSRAGQQERRNGDPKEPKRQSRIGTPVSAGSPARPNHGTLSSATNDIGTAVEFLTKAIADAPVPNPRASAPVLPPRWEGRAPTVDSNNAERWYRKVTSSSRRLISTRGAYGGELIDSREAARRFNGVLVTTGDAYDGELIDSREAARKYNGVLVE